MPTSESTPVAQIATTCPAAIRIFEQLGIDYCIYGTRSLSQVCREKGLDAAAVSSEIDRSSTNGEADWSTGPLSALIAHIVGTHHQYLRRELPLLADRLMRVAHVYAEREPQLTSELPGIFQALRDELSLHMRKEEMMLFPTIAAYEVAVEEGAPLPPTPFGSVSNPIRMMEHEHQSADGALSRLREITNGYSVPPYGCVTYTALMEGLRALEADLHRHIHLENNILFPRALALEHEHGGALSAHAGS